jgi:phosphoribosyl-AMP cyclohydrolase/phosphoribosyl-ATP pyrophosphohydrolase/phosphoribosyl-AMP cyclohydrolase
MIKLYEDKMTDKNSSEYYNDYNSKIIKTIENFSRFGVIEDNIRKLFESGMLVPTIVQDSETNEVLMLAYSNLESFEKTIVSGYSNFYSRSRKKLWQKGETSGHVQKIVSIHSDCDNDTILFKVIQTGPACHTGHRSCFFNKLFP